MSNRSTKSTARPGVHPPDGAIGIPGIANEDAPTGIGPLENPFYEGSEDHGRRLNSPLFGDCPELGDDDEGQERGEPRMGRFPPSRLPRRLGAAPHVPPLAMRLLPAVGALFQEFYREERGRWRFATATAQEFRVSPETFARYRLTSLSVIHLADRDARRMFLSDLRNFDGRAFPGTQLAAQLSNHFTRQLAKHRPNAQAPHLEEAVIPERLRPYTAYFPSFAGCFKPNQLMANHISKDLARGRLQVPGYTLSPFRIGHIPAGRFQHPRIRTL